MHVQCPRCHLPVDLVDNAGLDYIACPSCGSHISLLDNATAIYDAGYPIDQAMTNRAEAETVGRAADPKSSFRFVEGRTFGEYELLAEIARGGMGVVFRARQMRLNRTVALKMILAGQLADQDDVRRFLSEAEAAAGLDHPGIVPVYESGELDGQHFFSMGFVDGQSLAALLAAGPLPPRKAAELISQVADAVDYAHAHGVIHRDLKPGNILLDQEGKPRVTDFGLAKRVAGDSNLTRTGQALGTPSYMPPEQASGKLDAIGPASDVYALGAVLYAVLIGRPPFQAATPLDTILQVREQEPVAPRQLNVDLPRDLETIALKCLEKEPHKRYATAKELAEELRRFLQGEPIYARPIGRSMRAWRWCRRNPKLAALTATVFVLLATVAAGSTTAVVRIQREMERTDKARREANDNFRKAERQRKLAETAQQEALRNLKQVESERRRAETNFLKARGAVDQMLTRVGQERLSGVPQMEPVRRALLEDAVEFYRGFLDEKSDDPAVRVEMARAYQRLADIYDTLGQRDQARRAVLQGAAIFDKLVDEYPNEPDYRAGSANGLNQLGSLLKDEMNALEAERVYGQAKATLEKLVADVPGNPRYGLMLSETLGHLGVLREVTGKFDGAEEAFRCAVQLDEEITRRWPKLPEGRSLLADNCGNLERLLRQEGRFAEAEPLSLRSCEIAKRLAADFPAAATYQKGLATCYHNHGVLLDETGRRDEAEDFFRKAIGLRQRLANDFPHVISYRQDLAKHYNSLGLVLSHARRPQEAEAAFKQAIALKQKLAADLPSVPLRRRELANSFTNLGLFQMQNGQFDKADQAYREGIDLLERLVREFPAVPEYQGALGAALNDFAMATGQRDPQGARALLERAIGCQQLAIELNPRERTFHKFLRNHHLVLSRILLQLGEHADAAREATKMAELSFEPARDHYDAACYLARCVPLATKDTTLSDAERVALAEDYSRRAVEQLERAIAAGYNDFDHLGRDRDLDALRDRHEFRKLLGDSDVAPARRTMN
ncbi:MAG TPA: protein kinase [Pirellulales bacterium]|nr:protein kinase [Pirellulales bacterium]